MYKNKKNTYNKHKNQKSEEIMPKRMYKSEQTDDLKEDATQFGEFVCSYYKWIPLTEQKKKAEELSKMTKTNQ